MLANRHSLALVQGAGTATQLPSPVLRPAAANANVNRPNAGGAKQVKLDVITWWKKEAQVDWARVSPSERQQWLSVGHDRDTGHRHQSPQRDFNLCQPHSVYHSSLLLCFQTDKWDHAGGNRPAVVGSRFDAGRSAWRCPGGSPPPSPLHLCIQDILSKRISSGRFPNLALWRYLLLVLESNWLCTQCSFLSPLSFALTLFCRP